MPLASGDYVLHVQFAMHRHFSGKLNVFFAISLSLLFSIRLQLLTKKNIKYIVFKATQVSASHLFFLSRDLL